MKTRRTHGAASAVVILVCLAGRAEPSEGGWKAVRKRSSTTRALGKAAMAATVVRQRPQGRNRPARRDSPSPPAPRVAQGSDRDIPLLPESGWYPRGAQTDTAVTRVVRGKPRPTHRPAVPVRSFNPWSIDSLSRSYRQSQRAALRSQEAAARIARRTQAAYDRYARLRGFDTAEVVPIRNGRVQPADRR